MLFFPYPFIPFGTPFPFLKEVASRWKERTLLGRNSAGQGCDSGSIKRETFAKGLPDAAGTLATSFYLSFK